MRLSSCLRVVGLEGLAGVHDRPEHVDAAAGQGDDGLMVAFAFAAFAGVEGTASWRGKRAEGRLVEDPLEVLVAASGPAVVAGLAGLAQHRGQPGGGGELVGGGKAAKVACLSDELGGQGGPHAGQAADEGRVRVAVEQLAEVGVQPGDPLAAGKRLLGQLADQAGGQPLGGAGHLLGAGGGKGPIGQGVDVALGQAAGCCQVPDEPLASGSADLGWVT